MEVSIKLTTAFHSLVTPLVLDSNLPIFLNVLLTFYNHYSSVFTNSVYLCVFFLSLPYLISRVC